MALAPRTGPAVSCVFVCHDATGRVLLARRSAGARDEPGTWDVGAGALQRGESFAAAVRRQVREGFAAEALDVERIGIRDVLRGGSPLVAVVHAVHVDPATVAVGEPREFDALGWFALDALPAPLHSRMPAIVEVFRRWAHG